MTASGGVAAHAYSQDTTPGGLFTRLLDDAAIFPPGNAPMADAIAAHHCHRQAEHAPMVGAFVCSDVRWEELRHALGADGRALEVSLVVTGGPARLAPAVHAAQSDPRITLASVEVPVGGAGGCDLPRWLGVLDDVRPANVATYLELPLGPALPELVEVVARSPHLVKLRTGGTAAAAFPNARILAEAVSACLVHRVPFKLTAGLHHAVRHRDPDTGFEHHGFLNVLAAVAEGLSGASCTDLAGVLAERNPRILVSAVTSGDPNLVRRNFRSFGTCSISDPVADLRKLQLFPPVSRA